MPEFKANHDFYRWVNSFRKFWNHKLKRPTTEVFRLREHKNEKALSVFWSYYITAIEVKNKSRHKDTGVVSIKVKIVFELNLKPRQEGPDKAHVNVYGDFNEVTCQKLAESAKVEIPVIMT